MLGTTPGAEGRYSCRTMALDRARTARGALAGALAAGVWAAQQPLDKRAFACDYDDVELLGKAVTRGPSWLPVGLALHVSNGAVFGAVYANVAPLVPIPAWARGPLAGLLEHVGLWPLVSVTDRVHPARGDVPALAGNPRAFAQATWRHLLFGAVLGEVERRLNPPAEEVPPPYEAMVSPNGHGEIEHAVAASSGDEPGAEDS
jgi:hypothetical protein